MEYNLPPVVTPEQSPEPESPAAKKPRWNIFEAFKKSEPEAAAEPGAERSAEPPKQKRRFGESIMRLLRGVEAAPEKPADTTPAAEKEPAMPRPPEQRAAAEAPATPEQAPEPSLIERAQEMGRGVLALLKRVKGEVVAADEREHVVAPTDTQPLAEADEQVREAMRELVAPIEAYAAERGIPVTLDQASEPMPEASPAPAAEQDWGGSANAGSDRLPSFTGSQAPLLETAVAAAAVAAEVMSDRFERRTPLRRRLGLFAVGAATVGVLIYTWHRQREIRNEQKALKKEHKRFEKEVNDYQREERQRIEELERVQVESLSQAQRQAHVHEVSRFAVSQAEAIHTVARHQEERVLARTVHPTLERPVMPQQPAHPAAEKLQPFVMPAEVSPFNQQSQPTERDPFMPAEAPRRTFVDKEVRGSERRSVVERAMEALAKPKTGTAAAGGSTGGGLGGFANTLIGLTTGQAPGEPVATGDDDAQTAQPQTQVRRSGQEWLLGVGLALGVGGVLLLLINVL
jgi:hypothetical protein